MDEKKVNLLLVEDNTGDIRLILESLAEYQDIQFESVSALSLGEACELLKKDNFDVIILDLSLPDSKGLETLLSVKSCTPEIPVVILTGTDDEKLASQALQFGAQDYLIKGDSPGVIIARSLRYAIQRNQMQQALHSLSLLDDLTNLYNRRGFMTLAAKHLTLAKRTGRKAYFFYIDLDRFKEINDNYGHLEGDNVLKRVAEVLRDTFRESDIIGRIGGDEFAAIAIESGKENTETAVRQRLEQNLKKSNNQTEARFRISLSIGTSVSESAAPSTVETLLNQADASMYEEKKNKK